MPQPTISGTPPTCRFGGLALPGGAGTMSTVNLNDGTAWQWQAFQGDDDYPQLSVGQLAWRAKSTVIGRDRKARILTLPMRYQEASTAPSASLGAQTAPLLEAGPQQLTFDNATYILAEVQALKKRAMIKKFSPYYWSFDLEFLCPSPQFRDLSATTPAGSPWTLASGSATTFNITYAGSVWAEPVWTLSVPNTNAAPIQSFSLSSTMSGEAVTIVFPGNLAASTAWTITIDSGAMTVVDGSGKAYDVGGNAFPLLYPPAGTVNAMSATLTPASGTATGCTLAASVTNRWLL